MVSVLILETSQELRMLSTSTIMFQKISKQIQKKPTKGQDVSRRRIIIIERINALSENSKSGVADLY